MCRAEVNPEVEALLAEILHDLAVALQPDDPESVRVGPVDFGGESDG